MNDILGFLPKLTERVSRLDAGFVDWFVIDGMRGVEVSSNKPKTRGSMSGEVPPSGPHPIAFPFRLSTCSYCDMSTLSTRSSMSLPK